MPMQLGIEFGGTFNPTVFNIHKGGPDIKGIVANRHVLFRKRRGREHIIPIPMGEEFDAFARLDTRRSFCGSGHGRFEERVIIDNDPLRTLTRPFQTVQERLARRLPEGRMWRLVVDVEGPLVEHLGERGKCPGR